MSHPSHARGARVRNLATCGTCNHNTQHTSMLASTLRTALARSHSRTPVLASHLARAAATAATGTPSSAAAMQPATADDRPNIIADLKRDHASFFALHRRYSSELGLDQNDKQVIIWQLIHDIVVHSLAEEEVLYPEFKNAMGTRCRDHALSEHKTLKDILVDLDGMTIDSPGFEDKLEMLMHCLKHHIDEEENEMLAEFAGQVDRGQLEALAHRFRASKQAVPTRPHTIAPDKPITGNVVMNRLTAPIDKLRDAVSGRFAHKPGEHHQEAHAGAAAAPPAGPA